MINILQVKFSQWPSQRYLTDYFQMVFVFWASVYPHETRKMIVCWPPTSLLECLFFFFLSSLNSFLEKHTQIKSPNDYQMRCLFSLPHPSSSAFSLGHCQCRPHLCDSRDIEGFWFLLLRATIPLPQPVQWNSNNNSLSKLRCSILQA